MTRRLILKQASQGPQSLHASELPMLYRSYFALSDTTSACGHIRILILSADRSMCSKLAEAFA